MSRRGALAAVLPFLLVAALWLVATPRTELVSVGGGRASSLPGSESAAASQLLIMAGLLAGAACAATVLLWRRNRPLHRPSGVLMVAVVVALLSALTVTGASAVASFALGPDPATPPGEVVRLAPELGPLFFGPIVPLTSGPQWSQAPAFLGWSVLGVLVALATMSVMTYVGASRSLAAAYSDGPDDGQGAAPPHTGGEDLHASRVR